MAEATAVWRGIDPVRWLLAYDAVEAVGYGEARARVARRVAWALIALFLLFGLAAVWFRWTDNKPTVASTGLVTAHRLVALDWGGWFRENIWWRGKQTPAPLTYTVHGLFFTLFGYSVRGILVLHAVTGAALLAFLYRVTARRAGPWAGAAAVAWCLGMPLFHYVTLSGWTFIWATMFLLLAVDLADRAALTGRARWLLLAGIAVGCAGMSRPENYATALLFAALAPFAMRYRVAFLAIAFSWPTAQFFVNQVLHGADPGLRILDDARSAMGFAELFEEWLARVRRAVLNRNFSTPLQWLLLPAILAFGLPRHRLLAGIALYFWVAFFAAYAMRRISFNHEGYYFAHVVLAMPFLGALTVWAAGRVRAMLQRAGMAPARAAAVALVVVAAAFCVERVTLGSAWKERVFYRVPAPVRALRDALQGQLGPGDAIMLDYFPEVSWLLAEIEGPGGRNAYYYNVAVTGTPRPRVNAARKDLTDEEILPVNRWVAENLDRWFEHNVPRYLVMLAPDVWEREMGRKRAMGHYRMFGLRAAAPYAATAAAWAGGDVGEVMFENEDFRIVALDE
ncbi:MAG: glycosyltransferase family 39 protein [Candidatus Hydrogenedentes bacterium]|nr:glycosyltransferase family 39 protein [Candidatus Hydrogenedentota bacterium]